MVDGCALTTVLQETVVYKTNKTLTIFESFKNKRRLVYSHTIPTQQNTKENLKMTKIANMVEKIGETVTEGYQKIEDGVVGGYKKIENGVVEGFTKVTDKCVEVLFAKEGESVEDAKKRLSGEE